MGNKVWLRRNLGEEYLGGSLFFQFSSGFDIFLNKK